MLLFGVLGGKGLGCYIVDFIGLGMDVVVIVDGCLEVLLFYGGFVGYMYYWILLWWLNLIYG